MARRRSKANRLIELDGLIAEMTADAHDDDEQLMSFACAFDEVAMPAEARILNETVEVTAVEYTGEPYRGLTARCRYKDAKHILSLVDLRFVANPAARYQAAYRRWLGLEPFAPLRSGARTKQKAKLKASRATASKATASKSRRSSTTGGTEKVVARRSLREQVSFFEEQSLNGEYYEDFNVNSNNFMVSEGTQRWIRECLRLFDRLVAASARGHHNVTREGCEVLFALLRPLDQGDDGVIFFADEAGSWQVGVPWEDVLPAYFGSLAATVAPAVFGRSVLGVVDDFGKQERARYLRAARRVATAEQKRTLRPG